ncbi:MAG: EAL domain-containing protein [Thermomicrobia bacterium]|nr:EAL domain-containing protein [Thermomicrobia bacterium]
MALATGEITGFEALLRWEHPDNGVIAPEEFIPLAEEMGLIVPLGRWILQEACRQLRAWDDTDPRHAPFTISINVSARELRQADFVASVISVLGETGLVPQRLILEITESTLVEETETVMGTLQTLHDRGVAIHLDDFGMGYSSLSYLHLFPIDALKIDRSFVSAPVHGGIVNRAVIAAIVALAHTLQIAVTAEGIETAEQQAELEALRCEYGQGYRFSSPIAAAGIRDLVALHANENPLNNSERRSACMPIIATYDASGVRHD